MTDHTVAAKRAAARLKAKEQQRAKAQAQADADARRKPNTAAPKLDPKRPLTLHELNEISKRNAEATRDEDRAIAQSIAQQAFNSLQGRRTKAIAKRSAKAKGAQAALEAAQKAADDKGK